MGWWDEGSQLLNNVVLLGILSETENLWVLHESLMDVARGEPEEPLRLLDFPNYTVSGQSTVADFT